MRRKRNNRRKVLSALLIFFGFTLSYMAICGMDCGTELRIGMPIVVLGVAMVIAGVIVGCVR